MNLLILAIVVQHFVIILQDVCNDIYHIFRKTNSAATSSSVVIIVGHTGQYFLKSVVMQHGSFYSICKLALFWGRGSEKRCLFTWLNTAGAFSGSSNIWRILREIQMVIWNNHWNIEMFTIMGLFHSDCFWNRIFIILVSKMRQVFLSE